MKQIQNLLVITCVLVGAALASGDDTQPQPAKSQSPIQMLVPGFAVHELPVDLPNLNNVRYRADGKLYALGYNGDIWLLSDSNGDGFEDKAVLFFDSQGRLRGPIGMAVIPRQHVLLGGVALKSESESESDQAAPQSAAAQGIVVASKGKISAILDKDGDDVAEEEKIIADGWQEIPPNVDAIGVAIDAAGAIYFGLGTAAYNNAYLIDKEGQSQFDLASERGTIQRITPDLSKREIICTGVRFTIGMDFDQHGALFATDQEGATWLANGNPFDELLHIPTDGESKRHFGFPPRHPKHLPNVFDEPSLFNYAPQHQSTCGMAFNLPRTFSLTKEDRFVPPQTALFGPDDWRGDIFVTGESRGKLYRTELARTGRGQYVARNQLIACLSMLTVDCCVSPSGDLIVACHSGGPDWGTGPTGAGKLFAIRYSEPEVPQPIAAWGAGPQEVRVAFDRPLDPMQLKNLTARTSITYGKFVAAGDRFEALRPGYAAVQQQTASPRESLPVQAVRVTADRRTLVIATAPHRPAVPYALTLPRLGTDESRVSRDKSLESEKKSPTSSDAQPSTLNAQPFPQQSQIDLAYTLNGVLATWESDDKTLPGWSGVLPHLDLDVCRVFSTRDANDERFRELLKQPGMLTLQTQLDLRNLLHPAVQPGSRLDHEWPDESIRIHLEIPGAQRLTWTIGDKTHERSSRSDAPLDFAPGFSSTSDALPHIKLRIQTGEQSGTDQPAVKFNRIGWSRSDQDAHIRELSLDRFLLPWAETKPSSDTAPLQRDIPELAGGSWGRGRQVFFSEEASCAKCHVMHASGGAIGPDLSNLRHRDYASVLRDVTQPSFTINPDFLASVVLLKSGQVLTGSIRTENDNLLIGDKDGRVHIVARDDVEGLRHSPLSTMPEGISQTLGPDRLRDLLTFLLTEPPHMPRDANLPPSQPRTRTEVARVLAESQESRDKGDDTVKQQRPTSSPQLSTLDSRPSHNSRPLHILLVAGVKDHGPGEHDYPEWLRVWSELLRGAEGVTIETAMEWPTAEQFADADTVVFYQKGAWNAERTRAVDAHLAQGRGLVYIHWAIEGGAEAPAFAQRIGLASHAVKTKFRHGPLDLSFASLGVDSGNEHPIGRNFDTIHFHDESYWQLQGDPSRLNVIAAGIEDSQSRPLFWTIEPTVTDSKQSGRVFVSILGHYSGTFDDPLFRILLLRGIAWSVKQPVDRFHELATLGVELID